MIIVIVWLILTFMVASAGSKRNIGYGNSLIISLIFSPIIGMLFVLMSSELKKIDNNIDKYFELGKRNEFKGMIDQAIDNYIDAIYYMNKDIDDLSKYDAKERREDIVKLQNKIKSLKQKQINNRLKT